ncbi:MAG TPA: MFS transporter [Solirubrobacteraceae bacterium]|jgi:EmrB/QacA subfamily drug resistance transporter|nr:MFS transporter [Solirubrobacteraceae bacterium]
MANRHRTITLVACILGTGIAMLDSTVVNVALPTIQRHLGGGLAAQQWVAGAYLLTLGSLILLGGSLGDLFGERRVFSLGVAGFGLTSLLCAIAPTIGTLVAFRALQGVASALLTPSSLAVIVATFPKEERGAAIGTWTAWGGIATVIGPLAGGELLAIASWRTIFLINLPVVLVCLGLIRLAVAQPLAGGQDRRPAIDGIGAALAALGLAGPVFALIEQPRLGWSSAGVLVPLLAGAALLAAFIWRESRTPEPMLPLSLFRVRNFSVGNVETLLMYGGLSILFFFLGLFLQQVGGYSPLHAGLATLPVTVVMFVLSRRFGHLAARYGPHWFMGAGPLIAAAGLLLCLRIGVPVHYWTTVFPAVALFALGLSMTVAPLTTAVLAGIAERQAGIGSAVNNAVARIAGLLGTAAVGAVVAAHFASSLTHRLAGHALDARARAAVVQARHLTLGSPSVGGVPAAQRRLLDRAAQGASLSAFHLGLAIAGVLVALGGLAGVAGIRNEPSSGTSCKSAPASRLQIFAWRRPREPK